MELRFFSWFAGLRTFGAVERAIFAGWHAGLALESNAEIFDMGETGTRGDFIEGEIGLSEELFHALELDADDFLVRGAANEFDEALLHETS